MGVNSLPKTVPTPLRVTSLCQPPTSADSMTLPAFVAAERLLLSAGLQSADIFGSPGAQQQTRSSGVRRAIVGTDRLTDRQTDRHPHYYAVSANEDMCNTRVAR